MRFKPTLQQFQKFCKDHANLAHAVVTATAFAQCERERVDAYVLPIFQRYGFKDESGKPIKSPKQLYLCRNELDVADYFADCDEAHRAHGFKGPQGHCPALVAEELRRIAESALIDAGCRFLQIEQLEIYDMELRAKMLDLLMGACLKAHAERIAA